MELLANTGILGVPQEWFNDVWIYNNDIDLGCRPPKVRGTLDVNDYIESIVLEGRGVSGIELSVFQSLMLCEMMDRKFNSSILSASFYLRRRDIISQAISLYRGVKTGVFHSYQKGSEQDYRDRIVSFDYEALIGWIEFLIESEERFEDLFARCDLRPTPIFYEDLQENPLAIIRMIASKIGLPPPARLPNTTLAIMRDTISQEWSGRLWRHMPSKLASAIRARLESFQVQVESRILNRINQ